MAKLILKFSQRIVLQGFYLSAISRVFLITDPPPPGLGYFCVPIHRGLKHINSPHVVVGGGEGGRGVSNLIPVS